MPRPKARRDDQTAQHFLDAGAAIIDAALSGDRANLPPRLRAIHFPAALDWLRIEDVLRELTESGTPESRKAFRNRWPSKEEYIRDLVVHALLYRDHDEVTPAYSTATTVAGRLGTLSAEATALADIVEAALFDDPRSHLLMHIAPLLAPHQSVHEPVVTSIRSQQERWRDLYIGIMDRWNLDFRPGWTAERLTLAIETVVDGVLLKRRLDPEYSEKGSWSLANLLSDSILALCVGAFDMDRTGQSTAEWVDAHLGEAAD